jgi:hypothetical protein
MGNGSYKYKPQKIEHRREVGSSDDIIMLNGNVLVEIDLDMSEVFKKGDLWLKVDTSKHNADNTMRNGIVRKLPESFVYRGDANGGADWQNDIQIREGDRVWYSVVGAAESEKIILNEKLHFIIPYKEMTVAKRLIGAIDEDRALENVMEEDGKLYEIVMLNGYVLVQPKFMEQNRLFKLPPKKSKECTVCFCGEPNSGYFWKGKFDDDRINVGDSVRVHSLAHKYLEHGLHKCFNGKEEYMVVQRRHLNLLYGN